MQDRVELALTDDDVHLPSDAGVGEQFLDVEQAAGLPVDGVLRPAVAEHDAADRHLGVVDRQGTVGVVDREHDLGPTERRPARGAGEDDVFHLPAAQALGPLLAHHPGDGIDDVALAGAVGTDHAGDAWFEVHRRRGREGLEPSEREALEVQRGDSPWSLVGGSDDPPSYPTIPRRPQPADADARSGKTAGKREGTGEGGISKRDAHKGRPAL